MDADIKPVIKVSELSPKSRGAKGRFESATAGIAEPLGLKRLGARLFEVPPGKTVCPYHAHLYVDELFYILSGTGEYRFGGERYQVGPGDALGGPMGGAEKAHQLWNTGDEPLRYLAISSKAEMDVCIYPDSGKFNVFNASADVPEELKFNHIGRPGQALDYFDGED